MTLGESTNLEPWNPWQEFEEVQKEVDRLFEVALGKLRHVVPGREIAFVPVADIIETGEEYRFYLSLPGLVEEDIDITIEGQVLIIRGERDAPYDEGQVSTHLRQWKYGYFERRVEMPGKLESDAIRASYDAGVLTIRILKSP